MTRAIRSKDLPKIKVAMEKFLENFNSELRRKDDVADPS